MNEQMHFERAIRLDPSNCDGVWTLIGHEFMEMKNTAAACLAYRRELGWCIQVFNATVVQNKIVMIIERGMVWDKCMTYCECRHMQFITTILHTSVGECCSQFAFLVLVQRIHGC